MFIYQRAYFVTVFAAGNITSGSLTVERNGNGLVGFKSLRHHCCTQRRVQCWLHGVDHSEKPCWQKHIRMSCLEDEKLTEPWWKRFSALPVCDTFCVFLFSLSCVWFATCDYSATIRHQILQKCSDLNKETDPHGRSETGDVGGVDVM